MIATVAVTAVITALAVVLGLNFVGPSKKLERRIEHRYGIGDPQFLREMSVMLGPSILPGNDVRAYQNGDEIFPAMLEAIAAAKDTINFETYIYWSGDIGEKFTEALCERARAGVRVNMVVDWVGSLKMDDAMLERMREAGVRIHRYRPLRWYTLARLNNRTHRKLLVVDGRVGFTGGVGIADLWLGHAQDSEHWRDAHFRMEGPAVAQMQAAFNDNWTKITGEVLHGVEYFPPLEPAGEIPAHVFIASPAGGSESMHLMYLLTIAAAERSIDMAASYFVPDPLATEALIAARRRGVRVRVLLPGPHIDSDTVGIASKAAWGPLLEAGVEIYEYQPTMTHTKMLIVDGAMVSVGSTNFDARSFQLNDEASVNLYDRDFARAMTAVFEADLEPTIRYTHGMWRHRPLREKLYETLVLPLRSQL